MFARIDVASDSGLLVVHDAVVSLPVVTRDSMGDLERDAVAGKLFFLATDDPVRYRVDVYIGDTRPPELQHDFQPLGGMFLLDVPSGRLIVAGYSSTGAAADASIVLSSGPYVLTLMERRVVDGRRHKDEMVALVGEADLEFSNRSTWASLLGCLPTILALGSLVFASRRGEWRGFVYVALPVAVLAWIPNVLLRTSKRYRGIRRRMDEHEAAKPHYIITLAPTERTNGMSGGFVHV